MSAVAILPAASRIIHNREEWNRFIMAHPAGHVLQSWEWGEVKARSGWVPVRLAIGESDEIRGAAQVLLRRLPLGFGSLAYVPRGPVLDWRDESLRRHMVAALRALAAGQLANLTRDVPPKLMGTVPPKLMGTVPPNLTGAAPLISLKIEPEALDGPLAADLQALGFVAAEPVQLRSTILVDLTAAEEEMLARQKQKTRYNIRLAQKRGVTVAEAAPSELGAWYEMHAATARRDGFAIHSLDYYRLVLDVLRPRGMATLLLARHEQDLLAGIIVFRFGEKAQYMYGASSNEKRNLMAPYLVQWEGMRWAKAGGARVYDLWGIPDRLEENEDLWGVYRHKRGYGGEVVRYVGAFDLIQSPLRHAAMEQVARPLFKRIGRLRSQGLAAAARSWLEPVAQRIRAASSTAR